MRSAAIMTFFCVASVVASVQGCATGNPADADDATHTDPAVDPVDPEADPYEPEIPDDIPDPNDPLVPTEPGDDPPPLDCEALTPLDCPLGTAERVRADPNDCEEPRACIPFAGDGDINGDGRINDADLDALTRYLFASGAEPVLGSANVNCLGEITSADLTYLANFIYEGGPAPCGDPAAEPSALPGDADGNEIIDSRDVDRLTDAIFAAGEEPFPGSGDVNCDGEVTAADVVALGNFVFNGGPAPCGNEEAVASSVLGDTNCDGAVDQDDVDYLISYVLNGAAPPCPSADVGDLNCSGDITQADVLTLNQHIENGTAPAPCP